VPSFSGEPRKPLRNGLSSLSASSWKNLASCVAVKPSRKSCIWDDKRSYNSYPEAHIWEIVSRSCPTTGKETTCSITASLRQRMNLQHGIIGGNGLEGDICMPTGTGKAARVTELMGQPTAPLLLCAADHTDLVAELASFLGERVNMETRGLGLRGA